jgi:hypothetical protein
LYAYMEKVTMKSLILILYTDKTLQKELRMHMVVGVYIRVGSTVPSDASEVPT